jgi:glycosyltransferase involved in cell wall biosynthesis
MLQRLQKTLLPQVDRFKSDVEVKYHDAVAMTTGSKRNELIKSAEGDYTVFVDDDDHIADTYVEDILQGTESGADVIGIQGWMTTNGISRVNFEIRKGYPYIEVTRERLREFPFLAHRLGWYVRFPNILAPMKRNIAASARFPNVTHGEDYAWALDIQKRGLIKSEYFIEKMMYHYDKIIHVKIR